MSNKEDIAMMAHLTRRAGFGTTRDELEALVEQGYEKTVEQLVNPPHDLPRADQHLLYRFLPGTETGGPNPVPGAANWLYQMVNTQRPLEEKMSLFWHHVFATGNSKVDNLNHLNIQIQMFRDHGLGNYRDLLVRVAQNPAMIFWLDNNENHGSSINENYGREILELFSMGIGNYTEDDIKNAARAFTGWTYEQPIPLYPYGQRDVEFLFRADDHDNDEKTFLGHTGNLDGNDIIDIIATQEATARFIGRHLYNFFVADEAQVPAWSIEPPVDPAAIDDLVKTWMDSDADIRAVLRTLFTSDWFKAARFKRVKSPTEFVAAVLKLSGDYREPDTDLHKLEGTVVAMGQKLMDPPSVEGWHTGKEWIDGGTLTERVNYAVNTLNDPGKPGVRAIVDRIRSGGDATSPAQFVDSLLDLVGPLELESETRDTLLAHAEKDGPLEWGSDESSSASTERVVQLLTLVVSAREYQFN